MKLKKLIFVLAIGAVFVIGWLFTLRVASGTDKIAEQKSYVEEADAYIAKKLYVRGIPLLEKAAEIDTSEYSVVMRKLMDAYFGYGDMDGYYKALKTIDSVGEATDKDYLILADYYLNQKGDVEQALTIVSEGMEKHDEATLKEFYEKYIYDYDVRGVSAEKMFPMKWNTYTPAFSAGVWNYVNREGSLVLQVDSEEAYNFNADGYGVIKKEGVYRVILQNGDMYGIDEGKLSSVKGITDSYIIGEKDGRYGFYNYDFKLLSENLIFDDITLSNDGLMAVKKGDKWGIIKDNGEAVTDYIYEAVAIGTSGSAFESGIAVVKRDGKWRFIDTEGNFVSEESFADAKAPESNGYIAVANAEGKWGFADRSGKLVIDYQYEAAKSFSSNLSAVKLSDKWGYISRDNKLVIDNIYSEAEPFIGAYALVKNIEGLGVINLRYFELYK